MLRHKQPAASAQTPVKLGAGRVSRVNFGSAVEASRMASPPMPETCRSSVARRVPSRAAMSAAGTPSSARTNAGRDHCRSREVQRELRRPSALWSPSRHHAGRASSWQTRGRTSSRRRPTTGTGTWHDRSPRPNYRTSAKTTTSTSSASPAPRTGRSTWRSCSVALGRGRTIRKTPRPTIREARSRLCYPHHAMPRLRGHGCRSMAQVPNVDRRNGVRLCATDDVPSSPERLPPRHSKP